MKLRVISAFFLILIAVPLIIAGDKVFSLAVGVVGIFALKEVIDLKKGKNFVPFLMCMVFYFSLLLIIYLSPFEFSNFIGIDYKLISVLFIGYLLPTLYYHHKGNYKTVDAFYYFGMTLFLGIACHSLIMLRVRDLYQFLYLILIPIFTDTFAFLFGKLIGKYKLAPLISPKKTWEGSILGSICATIICSVFYYTLVSPMNPVVLSLLTFLLTISGQVGDLLFSVMKREHGVKDFSDLIPGHGGILDRFDSLIFTAVVFILVIGYY